MSPETLVGIPFQKFTCGARSPIDLYLDLGDGRFVKVVQAGDQFDRYRLQINKNPSEAKIYLRRTEFPNYLTYCVELSKRLFVAGKKNGVMDFYLSGRIIELMYTGFREMGLGTPLVNAMNELVDVLKEQTKENHSFSLFYNDLMNINDKVARHSFASTLIALVIVNGLRWKSDSNVRAIVMAGLLHDIGLLHSTEVFVRPKDSWSEKAWTEYHEHPQAGAALILDKQFVTDERVVRIVSGHEEIPDGSGFPNGLSLARIYPMALPIIMADRLVELFMGVESPLKTPNFPNAVAYLKNREERFYPGEYWKAIESATPWIK